MWTIYRYADEDITDIDGYIIHKKGTWYSIGSYDLKSVNSIIEHEIYLYNCTCDETTPQPRFKIESNFHKEDK